MTGPRVLAVIPARGGSKGLPGKNVRSLAGLPLIAHAILLAQRCDAIDRLIVSTDSPEIAGIAREYGVEIPFMRPTELARDETPMWPVVRHAAATVEALDGESYAYVLLLDPTTVGRLPEDIDGALGRLQASEPADGIVGVSRPEFNPIWHCVIDQDGWMADLIPDGGRYARRQDVPSVFRINASLYVWRRSFVRREAEQWRRGRLLLYEVPDWRILHIDDAVDLRRAELLLTQGFFTLPWLVRSVR